MKLLRPVCPLVAMDETLLPYWGGVDNLGGVDGTGDDNWMLGLPSDYGRVCAIKDLGIKQTAVLRVKDGDALVLDGEAVDTVVDRTPSGNAFIARIYSMRDGASLPAHLKAITDDDFAAGKSTHFAVSTTRLHLFEAGSAGSRSHRNEIVIDTTPGPYRVVTKNYKPDRETWLLLHLLAHEG
jgi:hypothetical protein